MAGDQYGDEGDSTRDGESAADDQSVTDDGGATERDLPGPLVEVLADPAAGRHRLPYLLGLLDGDDPQLRLSAGTAVCLVVEEHPKLLSYAVDRLVDRLDDDAPVEVAHALDYLAARHTKAVDEAVTSLDRDSERRARERMYRTGGGFARNEYLAPTGGDSPGDRARSGTISADDDPRQVRTRDVDERDRARKRSADGLASDDVTADAETEDDGAVGEARGHTVGSDDADQSGTATDADRSVSAGTLTLVSKRLSAVVADSRFDDFTVLTDRRRGRYGDVYRTAGTLDGEQHAVALTVYRRPETDRAAFTEGLQRALSDWSDVDDHQGVLTVYDWGVQPRPWAALDYTDLTLANRTAEPNDPLWTAVELADAVADAHQHGVVHGAIDPGNVASHDTVFRESERRRPLLTNVAIAAETGIDAPGVGVDPRYAAPEHYDDSYGRVDNATDVYGLGAVLYRLVSGRHPYDGDADAVREAVCSGDPLTLPETDRALPDEIEPVLQKATAAQKIRRYETVTQMERELRAVRGDDGT